MDKYPLVSVVIPTHNRAQLLPRAIESVLNQTYPHIELIIIDDSSQDHTQEIIRHYSDSDKRVTGLKNSANLKKPRSLNIGIKQSQGDFLTFLDDDSEFLPQKIERELLAMHSFTPMPGIIISNMWIEKVNTETLFSLKLKSKSLNVEDVFDKEYSSGDPSAWFCARSCVQKLNGFDCNFIAWEDVDFIFRAIKTGQAVYFLNQPLAIKHHAPGVSSLTSEYFKQTEKFLNENFSFLKTHRKYLSRFYYHLGKKCLKLDDFKKARSYFWRAFLQDPLKIEYLFKMI